MLLDHGLSWRQRGRPQPVNQAQDIGEQGSWDFDLRQLECDIAAVANNLGADLCRLLSQRSQLPVRRFFLPGLLPLRVIFPRTSSIEFTSGVWGKAEAIFMRADIWARASGAEGDFCRG